MFNFYCANNIWFRIFPICIGYSLENFVRLTLASIIHCASLYGIKPLLFGSSMTLIFIAYTGSGSWFHFAMKECYICNLINCSCSLSAKLVLIKIRKRLHKLLFNTNTFNWYKALRHYPFKTSIQRFYSLNAFKSLPR